MYKLKSIARRGGILAVMAALVVGAIVPPGAVFADALNPLTNRSLTLSSSSPGWSFTDGSGNSTYAPPNSGPNGKKTGNYFSFNVSTDSTQTGDELKAMTFQYCESSAGDCVAPGDNGFTAGTPDIRNPDSTTTSDLNVTTSTPSEVSNFSTIINTSTGKQQATPARDDSDGNFVVMYDNAGTWTQSTGWTMTASNNEDGLTVGASGATGKNNYITLANSTGMSIPTGAAVKVLFFATDANYITNPGSGAFFVKINTYNSDTTQDNSTLLDGGITVANVMNQSINIQTKVLETMDFSVGTVDPNTLDNSEYGLAVNGTGTKTHGPCDPIMMGLTQGEPENILELGNQVAENSLSTTHTYITHSYWRLSSNSSAGASVYYSGITLTNTVADEINAIGTTESEPIEGSEQFGLALDLATSTGDYKTDYNAENDAEGAFENGDDGQNNAIDASTTTDTTDNASWHEPQLAPLLPEGAYDNGKGAINEEYDSVFTTDTDSEFAFDAGSNKIPALLATENTEVVDCVTAKMNYIANIAATTPAGIYTTSINYIAAPQY